MPDYIHKDNIGTAFQLLIVDEDGVVDISGAGTMEILLQKPDGVTVLTKTATHVTDGTDGMMQYVSQSGDLDTAGIWKIQGNISLGGSTFRTQTHEVRVFDNL